MTARGESIRVHEPSTPCKRLRDCCRWDAVPIARSTVLAAMSSSRLRRVPNHHVVRGTGAPVQTKRAEQVVERRQCVGPPNRPRRGVADANQHAAILIADFESAEAEQALTPQRTAEREDGLLTVERRIADVIPIEELGQGLPALVAKEQRQPTPCGVSPPERVTTLMTEPADRPSSAANRFVAT